MPKLDLKDAKYNYSISGHGDPIVLITGFGGNIGFWKRATELLSDEFTVISVDNRGAGETEYSGNITIDIMADDVIALLDHLNYDRAHILGWSMGSHIAQSIAIRYPAYVRTLTLVSTYRFRPSRTAYLLKGAMDAVEEGASFDIFGKIINGLGYTESYFKKKENDGTEIKLSKASDMKRLKDQFNAICEYDTTETAPSIKAPTMIIHGTDDIMVDIREGRALADLISGCERIRLNDVGHLVPSDRYIPQVIQFIKDQNRYF